MKLCAACNNTFADTETFCPHDGEVLQESPENIVGQVIEGKYKVEGFIAQGGMGAVYRARHILLGKDHRGGTIVKVLDLGIAKMVGAGDVHAANATSLTVAGQILGTPYYMSPEQWGEMPRDGNPEVDGRTDIYSLGVIFFELVAGRKPLGGRTLSELRHKHVAAPLPTLAEVATGVPEAFSRGVAHAMAKDRSDRPQAAGDFIDELRAALGLSLRSRGHGVHATDAGQIHATDAGRAPSTHGQMSPSGEAATGHLSPETNAEHLDHSHAATILTSDLESPATEIGRASCRERGEET